MPNQSNPDQGQQNGLGTTPIVQQSDLPPLPVDFTGATPAALQPEVTVPAPSSTSGEKSGTSAPPPPAFSDITTPPKKKFGTGKIIATILGIFVLVGGVAAAVLTINQKQLFQQKAEETIQSRWPANGTVCYSTGGNQERVGGCIVFYCPNGCSGVCNEGSPGVYTEYYMDPQNCNNASNALGNYCGQIDVVDTNGRYCQVPGYGDLIQCTASCTRPPPRTPTPTPTPRVTLSPSPSPTPTPTPRVTLSPSPSPTPTPSPSPTSSPTPLAPYCVAVSTYRDTSSEGGWMLIPPADRPMLKTSDEIYFCVSGYRGVFDKARFTITRNGVAGSPIETTSLRPNSTDFCIPYTILSGTVDINVKGELHDSVGNRWTGGISVD